MLLLSCYNLSISLYSYFSDNCKIHVQNYPLFVVLKKKLKKLLLDQPKLNPRTTNNSAITYKFLISIWPVDDVGVARNEFSNEMEIFGVELVPIMHKFDVLLSNALFYRRWHFRHAQFRICNVHNRLKHGKHRHQVHSSYVNATYTKTTR